MNIDLVDTWGLYPEFLGDKRKPAIHPDDFDALKMLRPFGKVFHCVGMENDFLILRYFSKHYRVMPRKYEVIPPPKFTFIDVLIDLTFPESRGYVQDINWNERLQKHLYAMYFNGNHRKTLYYEDELEVAAL